MIEDFRPLSSLSAFTKFHDGWDRLTAGSGLQAGARLHGVPQPE